MTIQELTKILEAHGITFWFEDGKVIAEDEYTYNGELHTDILDMTYISKEQLWDWLGY
jgi:hypothetical protein